MYLTLHCFEFPAVMWFCDDKQSLSQDYFHFLDQLAMFCKRIQMCLYLMWLFTLLGIPRWVTMKYWKEQNLSTRSKLLLFSRNEANAPWVASTKLAIYLVATHSQSRLYKATDCLLIQVYAASVTSTCS